MCWPIKFLHKQLIYSYATSLLIKYHIKYRIKIIILVPAVISPHSCINALNNQPGVRSKRFQKENGGFKKTFEIIINEAKRKNNYNAFFQTTIALTTAIDNTIYFTPF